MLSVLSSPDSVASPKTRAKAVYVISNATKHNAEAVRRFDTLGGWQVLKGALKGISRCIRAWVYFELDGSVPVLPHRFKHSSPTKDGVPP